MREINGLRGSDWNVAVSRQRLGVRQGASPEGPLALSTLDLVAVRKHLWPLDSLIRVLCALCEKKSRVQMREINGLR
jgi:hypothetical protein